MKPSTTTHLEIAADRCFTHGQALHWTCHLLGKDWADKTDWLAFIRKYFPTP